MTDEIADTFVELGKPENVGQGFAITAIKDVAGLPQPDYPHAIYLDTRTDNYLVVRADADGAFWPGPQYRYANDLKRIR